MLLTQTECYKSWPCVMKKGQITNVMEPFVSIIAAISLYDVLLTYN